MSDSPKTSDEIVTDFDELHSHLAICKKHGLSSATISTHDFEVLLTVATGKLEKLEKLKPASKSK